MSESGETEEAGLVTRAYRTVTPATPERPDVEMDVIGWSMFLGLLLLLLPLLPFVLIVWVVTKVLDALTMQAPEEETE